MERGERMDAIINGIDAGLAESCIEHPHELVDEVKNQVWADIYDAYCNGRFESLAEAQDHYMKWCEAWLPEALQDDDLPVNE